MDIPVNIEFYSAMPYGGNEEQTADDWFHISRNTVSEHIEAVWDVEKMFRPDIPEDEKPTPLMGIEGYFEHIRLHYALNYTSWKYHEDLMIWCLKALKPGGNLTIICPDLDWILMQWMAEAVGQNPNDYIVNTQADEIKKLREKAGKSSGWINPIKAMVSNSGIPIDDFSAPNRNEMEDAVPMMKEGVENEWDFDLWLMQQLYSSGSGEPQDSFKAVFGRRYLSVLLRKTQFVVKLLQSNPENPKQLEAKAFKHKSRLMNLNAEVVKNG